MSCFWTHLTFKFTLASQRGLLLSSEDVTHPVPSVRQYWHVSLLGSSVHSQHDTKHEPATHSKQEISIQCVSSASSGLRQIPAEERLIITEVLTFVLLSVTPFPRHRRVRV